jgi:thiamine biosynthesis protein ThiI
LASRLYLVPFGRIQQQVVTSVPPQFRVVIYRRLMLRIAERLAFRAGASALVTGDALGQVASQTIENIHVVGRAATIPVLRPLVGMDKEEITSEAKRLGSYEISILPDEDCCTLFTPRFPSTRSHVGPVDAAERALDLGGLVSAALEGVEVADFRFPVLRSAILERGETRA